MRFLLDLNTGGSIAEWLASQNHDVLSAGPHDVSISDEEILRWAIREQRIVITTDRDFEEMVFHRRLPHWGLIRLPNVPRKHRLELLRIVLKNHSTALLAKAIILVDSTTIRIRSTIE